MMDRIECKECGTLCNQGDRYCRQCHATLPTEGGTTVVLENTDNNDSEISGLKQSDWQKLIDKNADRYVAVFTANKSKKFFIGMNRAAFFFPAEWLFYRKMYIHGTIWIIAWHLLIFINSGFLRDFLLFPILLIFHLVPALLGDCWYRQHLLHYQGRSVRGTSGLAIIISLVLNYGIVLFIRELIDYLVLGNLFY